MRRGAADAGPIGRRRSPVLFRALGLAVAGAICLGAGTARVARVQAASPDATRARLEELREKRRRSLERRGRNRPATAPSSRPAGRKPAGRKAKDPSPPRPREVSDAEIARSIRRGLDYLYGKQKPDGTWDSKYARQHPGGVESLVLLAGLSAGEDVTKAPLAAALKQVNAAQPMTVYARAVRAMMYSRLPQVDYAVRLAADVAWLAKYQNRNGGWGYGPGHATTLQKPHWTDVSNTFLAMLALREARDAGADVPKILWTRCKRYWTGAANADGGISYQPPGGTGFRLRGSSYGSMTAAGLTSLLILSELEAALDELPYTGSGGTRAANPSPYAALILRALKWLNSNYALRENPKWVWGGGEAYEYYYLYCLQHVADEGGVRWLDSEDLTAASARLVIDRQRADGSWVDPGGVAGADDRKLTILRTCFALLALAKARGAIVIQKLALPGQPTNDPRDAANLARWLGRTSHWTATWRTVRPDADVRELARAPILYLNVSSETYPPALADKIRAYLREGGTVLVQPFGGSQAALAAARAYFATVLPGCTGRELPMNHPVYSVRFKLPLTSRPALYGISDACRTRVFILTSDLSGAWHQGRLAEHPDAFHLAANILLYTTDLNAPKRQFAGRPSSAPRPAPLRRLKIARVKHAGQWNVCPQAAARLNAVLNDAVSIGLADLGGLDLTQPVPKDVVLLWLTGAEPLRLDAARQRHLKQYLAGGGTLLVDSAMGGGEPCESAAALLNGLFGPGSVSALPEASPLLTGAFAGGIGSDVTRVRYTRAAAAAEPDLDRPRLSCLKLDGRIAAVLCPCAVACPVEGHPTYGCKGLATRDARRLAANVVLYAAASLGGR